MINKERMVSEFINLTKIDSISSKERQMADEIKSIVKNMGISVIEDNAGERIGGNAGNLICTIKGTKKVPAILFMAHMDTVTPGKGKKAVIDGNIIKSDGKTILGADDLSGVECILEAIRIVKEKEIEHGDIQIAFTVAEESGLLGAKNLDYDKIHAEYGFVMDTGGPIGTVAINAPSQNEIKIEIMGKAAHAGVEPEKGINAIQIAAQAISKMKLGRIDEETTANVGIINGGHATNVICDSVTVEAEARSIDIQKLNDQTDHMRNCFVESAAQYGGAVNFKSELMYPSFSVEENDNIIDILRKASKAAGIELNLIKTGGGSDTNIINGKGIKAVNVSVGMDKVHSVNEQICIDDMIKAAELIVRIIENVE